MFSRPIPGWGKKTEKKYPALAGMLRVFLSCHHDDFGTSIEEILQNYIDYQMPVTDAMNEINRLLLIEKDNELSTIMVAIAGDEFRPGPWGETWRSFLNKALIILNSEH